MKCGVYSEVCTCISSEMTDVLFLFQYLMQCYLRIQQQARKQAEREHLQISAEHDSFLPTADGDPPRTKSLFPTIHFVETASSVLRELPWILPKEHKVHVHALHYGTCVYISVQTPHPIKPSS